MQWMPMIRGAALVCLGLLAGCSKGTTDGADSAAAPASGKVDASTPQKTVYSFLDAVRQGNDETVSGLLTDQARAKTKEMEMVVAPPGSDTASFEVGEAEEKDGTAQVASTWTDVDPEGKPQTHYITWILRQEGPVWRISGMATQVFEGEELTVFNFENPAEMLEQRDLAEKEAMRRNMEESSQASRPEDPFRGSANE